MSSVAYRTELYEQQSRSFLGKLYRQTDGSTCATVQVTVNGKITHKATRASLPEDKARSYIAAERDMFIKQFTSGN